MPKGRIPRETAEMADENVTGESPFRGRKKGHSRTTVIQDAVRRPKGVASVESLSAESLSKLQHIQTSISQRLEKGELSAALIREAAGLSRSIIALGAEMRQQEKFYEQRVDALTDQEEDELVLEFISELPPHRRRRYRDALLNDDDAPTLLG